MNNQIISKKTPEEIELDEKLTLLKELENDVSNYELSFATISAELRTFNYRYLQIIGQRLAKLDTISAQIAELLAFIHPNESQYEEQLKDARSKERESTRDFQDSEKEDIRFSYFQPSRELKNLYRSTAKLCHPDLSNDEKDKYARTKFMMKVNKAYQDADEDQLQSLFNEWNARPESIQGDDIGSELIRTIRKIDQVKRRIEEIERDINELEKTDLFNLKLKIETAGNEGHDILEEMAVKLDIEIREKESRLNELKALYNESRINDQ